MAVRGTKQGLIFLLALGVVAWILHISTRQEKIVLEKRDPNIVSINVEGKTKVFRHNGDKFDRLHEFCTWTLDFNCHMLKTPAGRVVLHLHKPGTDRWASDDLIYDKEKDVKEIGAIMDELRPNPDAMYVDVGANLGVYVMTVAKTMKRKVLAIDPLVQNTVRLCKTIQDNHFTDNITLIFNALSDKYGTVGLYVPPKQIEATKVLKWDEIPKSENPLDCRKPPTGFSCKLDDLLPFMTSKTAVLKIDVETHEYRVLAGGQRFLEEIDVTAIFMEWVNVKQTPDGKLLVDFLKERNYFAYDAVGSIGKPPLDFNRYMQWPFNVMWRKKK